MAINKVLVVDDVLTDRTNLQNILLDAGYQVSIASSGSEALTIAAADQPEVTIKHTITAVREIDEAIAFLNSQADLIPGYERRLAQATESARLCAAFRFEKGNELAAALTAQ